MTTSSNDSLVIPIVIDNDNLKVGLQETDKILSSSFDSILNKVASLSNKSVFSLNTKDVDKSISDIDQKIKKLTDTKNQLSLDINSTNSTKQIAEIEKRIATLNAEKELKINISNADKKELESVEKRISNLTDSDNNISIDIDSGNAKEQAEEIQSSLDELESTRSIKVELDEDTAAKTIADSISMISKIEDTFNLISGFASDIGNSIVSYQEQLLQNQIEYLESAYQKEMDLLDEKYEAEQEKYCQQLEELQNQKSEYEQNLEDIENERLSLEAEKEKIMSEEEYALLQKKIADKEAEAQAESELIASIEQQKNEALANQEAAEQNYQNIKEERERQYLIDKAELEYKQAESSKKIALFDAGIALAAAIMQATLAGMQFGIAAPAMIPILTALAAATGALQIATIASTPLPEIPAFSSGGYVSSDYSGNYSAYGLTSPNSYDNTLAWLSTGERVLSVEESKVYEDIINSTLMQGSSYNTSNSTNNSYNISVNVAEGSSSPKKIAQEVIKAIRGRA